MADDDTSTDAIVPDNSSAPSGRIKVTHGGMHVTYLGHELELSGEIKFPAGTSAEDIGESVRQMSVDAADNPALRKPLEDFVKSAQDSAEKELNDADPNDPTVIALKEAIGDKDATASLLAGVAAASAKTNTADTPAENMFTAASRYFGTSADAPVENHGSSTITPHAAQPQPFAKEMAAAVDHAFGPGAAKRLWREAAADNATVRPIVDKDTGGILGAEILVKKNKDFLPASAEPKAQGAMLKIFINMSPVTMQLDSGKQAKIIDLTGAQLSQARSRYIDSGAGYAYESKTPYETVTKPGEKALLILADDGNNGGGKFALGKYDGHADFSAVETRGNVQVDVSNLRPTAHGEKPARDLRLAFAPPAPGGPQLLPPK